MTSEQPFADVLAANEEYARAFTLTGLRARAAKRLVIVTCMDTRIEPLAMLGLRPGDAKILRNAGGRVTDDVLGTLVVARYLLDVDRVMVVQHTNCRMASPDQEDLHRAIGEAGGPDTRDLRFVVAPDQDAAVRADVDRIRQSRYLDGMVAGGFMYDVETGLLRQVC